MTTDEVWVKDPHADSRHRKTDWNAVVERVVDNPGEYLLVDRNASPSMAGYINREGLVAFRDYPQYEFHAMTNNTDRNTRKCHLYLRATKRKV